LPWSDVSACTQAQAIEDHASTIFDTHSLFVRWKHASRIGTV
jgi:hypothetical protein